MLSYYDYEEIHIIPIPKNPIVSPLNFDPVACQLDSSWVLPKVAMS